MNIEDTMIAGTHDGSEKTLRCMKYGGARIKTALVYLNDVEEGGSTCLNQDKCRC